jgi:hypothetical protein
MTEVCRSVPILTFHSLDDLGSVISFSPALFQRGLSRLREHGYRTIDLMEAVDILSRGTMLSPPDRCFVITFDDGYGNNYREAFAVLQQLGMSATVFLTVGAGSTASAAKLPSLNGRDMLSWSEIREMHHSGVVRPHRRRASRLEVDHRRRSRRGGYVVCLSLRPVRCAKS